MPLTFLVPLPLHQSMLHTNNSEKLRKLTDDNLACCPRWLTSTVNWPFSDDDVVVLLYTGLSKFIALTALRRWRMNSTTCGYKFPHNSKNDAHCQHGYTQKNLAVTDKTTGNELAYATGSSVTKNRHRPNHTYSSDNICTYNQPPITNLF